VVGNINMLGGQYSSRVQRRDWSTSPRAWFVNWAKLLKINIENR